MQAYAYVRVAADRRARLGAEAQGRPGQTAGRNSRGRSGLLSRAKISELRKPRAEGYFITRSEGSLRRGSWRWAWRTRRSEERRVGKEGGCRWSRQH